MLLIAAILWGLSEKEGGGENEDSRESQECQQCEAGTPLLSTFIHCSKGDPGPSVQRELRRTSGFKVAQRKAT